jgi:hypothetical protein
VKTAGQLTKQEKTTNEKTDTKLVRSVRYDRCLIRWGNLLERIEERHPAALPAMVCGLGI